MSKIHKLSILGVRSFDNVKSEAIEFYQPLTLIVGLNGSGKTTIIECLKYATTGELPPNTKPGGAFVHDPKLSGEKEVLAQVKISFHNAEGVRMVCTRSMSLTVSKTGARKFSTLDGSLNMTRGGEKFVASQRLADINSMIPNYLGVSRAVLDSVIFCHQEESLWPLAASKDLKVRFDAIFEAVKYTKAIENIKVLQKRQREELGLAKKELEHCKFVKTQGEKVKQTAQRLFAEIEALRKESDEKHNLMNEAAAKSEAAFEKSHTAGKVVYQLEEKRKERKFMQESLHSLRENLNEMSDSDAELQDMIEKYDERVKAYEEDYESSKDHYRQLEKDIKDTGNQVSAKERECGSYESQKENHDRQVENREKLIKEAARSHNIRGFDVDIDDKQVAAFMERITKMARDQNAEFERVRQETRDELKGIQDDLNELNGQRTSKSGRKETARQAITKNDSKINDLQGQLNKINIDEGAKAAMEASLRETESKLEAAKSDGGSADLERTIEHDEAELRALDDRKEKLNTELIESGRQAGESARLDLVQNDLKAKQSSLETMTGAHGDKISSIVGQGWTPATLETKFQQALDQSNSHVADAENQRDGTSREMQQLDYKLNECRTDLKAKRAEAKQAAETIRQEVGVEPLNYHEEVKKLEDSRDIVRSDADSISQILEYLDACLRTADNGGCRTCCRAFANDKEKQKMINTVKKEKEQYDAAKDAKKDLPEMEKDLQAARAVSTDFDAWERLTQKEIPALESNEKELAEKREKLLAQLEDQDEVVDERQAAKRDVQSLSKTVQAITNYSIDISNFEVQIKELLAKQKAAGLSRGVEIIQEEFNKVNDEVRSVKTRLAKSTRDRDQSKAYMNNLEFEKRDIKSKLSTAEYELKEKISLDRQVEEYKASNAEQREAIKMCDNDLAGISNQLKQIQAKYDEASRRGADKDRNMQADVSKLNNTLNRLKMADDEIKAYIDRGGPEQLARGKREIKALKDEVERLEREKRTVMGEVKTLEDKLRSHSDTRRSISDNQRYRRDLRALEAVQEEIKELETHNAEQDYAYWKREGEKWQNERNKLSAEESKLMGSLSSKDQTLIEKNQELEGEYKNAARKYKEAHIKVETTKACVEDLGRYGTALDKAIMKYHSIKMEEINRIIDDLWRKTYQGTDVDTIMIRSETEGEGSSRKSHNYRVCMVKQDAEMDMRGRCSAGQKVLASIIIRLALAECFGKHCGLIALDEPTTNLDRDNIRALAESLSEIIKIRREQKNFQLIVITHDEEFLRYMGCSDYTEYYWRVSRNERQKSVIMKQSIAEVY